MAAMKPALILFLAALSAAPAPAQEPEEAPRAEDIEEGLDLLGEGARRLLRGLMGEVEPRMRALAEALEAWDFEGLGLDDLGAYHPPEMLPNGDIIIRRKRDLPGEDEYEDEGEIEL